MFVLAQAWTTYTMLISYLLNLLTTCLLFGLMEGIAAYCLRDQREITVIKF